MSSATSFQPRAIRLLLSVFCLLSSAYDLPSAVFCAPFLSPFLFITIVESGLYVSYFHQHSGKPDLGHFFSICFQ